MSIEQVAMSVIQVSVAVCAVLGVVILAAVALKMWTE